ncbi:MAG: serine/threonine-protein kinase PknK, partial [Desulfobacteraceae bacterium]|nr:serine/threonine-protein kinase PknK [Desulfobacteraceae bacterium]
MQNLLGYKIQTKLYESKNTLVFRANKQGANSVILKVLKSEKPTNEEIHLFHNEYNLTLSLSSLTRVIKTYGLERDENRLIMLIEDFGATSLDKLLNQTNFSIEQVLDIAIAVIEGLNEIHCASIIHKDINPSNIVMNPDNGQIKLIDFGIASSFNNKKSIIQNPNIVEGTLSYIPPEQTGRIDRAIDLRADFYSFGATIYELIAHKPPFNTTDHMDLIYCHLAKVPIPLSSILSDIPEMVSKIIMKLMSKDAEERYASAKGIRADLQQCVEFLKKGEKIFSFSIDNDNNNQTLKIGQKLFGRKKEMEQLQSIFQQVLDKKKNMVFIKGPAGIGKTLLIQEIEEYVCKNNGIFISGKFNLLQQTIPYTGIIQAFRQLARHLLTQSDQELNKWKKIIQKAIGNQGNEIIELVPEFKKILGQKAPVPDLGGHEARNRFYLMVETFLSVFARQTHPLVLFLDDLQWVDPSSLKLIKQIISSPVIESLFIIGAFRDNEVDAEHLLQTMLERLKKEDVKYQSIKLTPLDLSYVSQLIAECLNCPRHKVHSLAQWIHARSLGNPFCCKELLSALNDQKKLIYDIPQSIWKWDLGEIQALSLPKSITELLAKKIQALNQDTQNILMLAACIGTTFELSTLIIVCERSRDDILAFLKESIEAGLILSMDDKFKSAHGKENIIKDIIYRFTHDRVHSAAYNLMPRDKKPEFHWQTGQLLLRKLPEKQRDSRIFEIVNHLNKGRILLNYGPEQKELARYNLKAGQKAKSSAAFDSAYTYFKIGINLLESINNPNQRGEKYDTQHWKKSYELISTLYLGAIETAYLSTKFNEVEQLGTIFLANVANLPDQLLFYSIKVQACYALNLMEDAVSTALHALELAGIRIPSKPKKWKLGLEYLKTHLLLSGKSMDSLVQMQMASDSKKVTILNIMRNTLLPSYYVNADLFPILVFKAIQISLCHGSSIDSAFAFAGYGMILSGFMGKLEKGYQFGSLAVRLLESFNTNELGAKILVTASTFTTHWKKHLKKILPLLEKAYEQGLETGDF